MAATLGVVVASAGALAAQPTRTDAPDSVGQATGCEQPYEPWFQASTYPETVPVPSLGEPINYGPEPDTDGDGIPDTIVDAGNGGTYASMTITRGDGVITLTPGTHDYVYLDAYGRPPGDLDGDGRDELIIGVDQQGEQYVLPGATAPGTHAIDDVGIFTDAALNGTVPVGDQDADGKGDVAGSNGAEIEVLSGAEIMAPGPGAAIGPLTSITTYVGSNVTSAILIPGEEPTIITGRVEDGVRLTVHAQPPVELAARNVYTEYTGGVGTIGVYQQDGDTFVSQSASDRSGSSIAIWNLTDPCSRYVAPTEVPTTPAEPEAAPAMPVEGTAGYTG